MTARNQLHARLFDVFDDAAATGVVADMGEEVDATTQPRESDRGRGLDLMRALMDEVELEAGDAGTTVRMKRKLGVAARNGSTPEAATGD